MEATTALRDFLCFPSKMCSPAPRLKVALEGNRGSVDSSPHDLCFGNHYLGSDLRRLAAPGEF